MHRAPGRTALLVAGLLLLATSISPTAKAGTMIEPELELYGAAHQGSKAPSDFFVINPINGAAHFIGQIGFNTVGAMDFDPRTGTLYGTGRRPLDGTPVLITINRLTGEGTEVGPLVNVALGDNPFDISFGKTDGVLYLTAFGVPGESFVSFFSVDTSTGLATKIGDSPTEAAGNGFGLDGVDNAYLINHADGGTLYSVDLETAGLTREAPISYLGFPKLSNPRINAIEVEQGTNFVSINDGNMGNGPNYLGVVNLRDMGKPIPKRSGDNSGSEGGPTPEIGAVVNLGQTADGLDALAALPAPRLFGAAHLGNGSPSMLYSLNVFTGSETPIGPIGFDSVGGMDFHPFSGILYATGLRPGDGEKVLITIDPHTGIGAEVGPLVNAFGSNIFDLSFRGSDSTLFATGISKPCVTVFTIDTTTGLAKPVGPTSTCDSGNGLATDVADRLYHTDAAAGGTFYEVDPTTGESNALFRLTYLNKPVDQPRINAMEFVPGFNIVAINDGLQPLPGDGAGGGGPNYLGLVVLGDGSLRNPAVEGGPATPLPGDVFFSGQTVTGLDAIAAMPPSFVYGAAHVDGSDFASTLYRIDPDTGAFKAVGPIGFDMVNGLDFEPGTGKLFGIGQRPGDGTQVTITVDPITGQGFEVGPLVNASFGPNDHDISFRGADGELFTASFGNSCIDLFTIATNSGLASEIGTTNTCAPANALGFDAHDNLFHLDLDGAMPPLGGGISFGSLNQLDQVTGAATTVAPLIFFDFPILNSPTVDAMELTPGLQLVSVNDTDGGPQGGGGPTPTVDYLATILTSDPLPPLPGDEAEGVLPGSAGAVTFVGQTVPFLDSLAAVTQATDAAITSEGIFADGFESGDTSAWSAEVP